MNLCRGCGRDFGSMRAFDKHRVGVHAYTFAEGMALEPPAEGGRRCLDEDELPEQGFVRNHWGRWTVAADAERGRAQTPARKAA